MTDQDLKGRVALVTGGGRGIGRACCEAIAAAGADVAVNYCSNKQAAEETAKLVESTGRRAMTVRADVSSSEEVARMVADVEGELGPIDLLVNNAGIFDYVSHEETTPEQWQRTLDINLTGAMHVARESIPYLQLGWDPSVIIVGSKNVPAPGPAAGAYSVAKAGLTQLARVLALELAADGIRVNTVHPNAVFDTAIWTDEVLEGRAAHYGMSVENYRRNNLLRQEVTSADVAAMVCVMAGSAFRCTTGAQLPIDGGNERVL